MESNQKLKKAFQSLRTTEKYKKTEIDESRHKPETVFKSLKSSFLNTLEQICKTMISTVVLQIKSNRESLPDYIKTDKISNKRLFLEKTICDFLKDNFVMDDEKLKFESNASLDTQEFLKTKVISIFRIWITTQKFTEQMEIDCQIIVENCKKIDFTFSQRYISIALNLQTYLEQSRAKKTFFNININKYKEYFEKKKQGRNRPFNFKKHFLETNYSSTNATHFKKSKKEFNSIDERKNSSESSSSSVIIKNSEIFEIPILKSLDSNEKKKANTKSHTCLQISGFSTAFQDFDKINEVSVIDMTSKQIDNLVNIEAVKNECPFKKLKEMGSEFVDSNSSKNDNSLLNYDFKI